jgi:hypothetical protein
VDGTSLFMAAKMGLALLTNVYFHRAGLYRLLGARWLAATEASPVPPANRPPSSVSASSGSGSATAH